MTDAEIDVWQALRRFLDAFENGDTDAMRSAFSDDAVTFPRAGTGDREHSTSPRFRRVPGIDPEMLRVASRLDAAERRILTSVCWARPRWRPFTWLMKVDWVADPWCFAGRAGNGEFFTYTHPTSAGRPLEHANPAIPERFLQSRPSRQESP